MRCIVILIVLAVLVTPTQAATFREAPILEEAGIHSLNRTVTRAQIDRDLFAAPYATAVIGHVDVYEGFPYLESRWFQVVSDPTWGRLMAGEMGGRVSAFDADGTSFGPLRGPRGLATDEFDRVWVADTGNDRIVVFQVHTEYDRIELTPRYAIDGLASPYDVAYSDGGTPFAPGDDRVYVADSGHNRVVAFDVRENEAREAFAIGELGNGEARFAGPLAVAVGHEAGAATNRVYVADAHNGRIVSLHDRGDRFDWIAESSHDGVITALDTDHWGALYAASPTSGVTKYTADLAPLASLDGVDRPRAFHVPFVNRTVHRTGERQRVGQGAGLVVEEWTDRTGIRLVRLGVEVKDLTVREEAELAAEFMVTDRSTVRADFLDGDGRLAHSIDLGERPAGTQHVSFAPSDLGALPSGTNTLRITATSGNANATGGQSEASFSWAGGVSPASVRLIASEPNPFRTSTSIRFAVPATGSAFDLRVFDIAGRLVRVIDSGIAAAGVHARSWDGADQRGRTAQAGIYFVQLTVQDEIATKKVVLLR